LATLPPAPGPCSPCHRRQGTRLFSSVLSLYGYSRGDCPGRTGRDGREGYNAGQTQVVLFTAQVLRGALIEGPPVMSVSPSPSTACHNELSLIRATMWFTESQDHSCKMKGLFVNLCLYQILRDLCSCPPKTPPPPHFCMYERAKKPICPLERGKAVITT